MIKLAIADDHMMFAAGIESMLTEEKDIEVVAKFKDGRDLLDYLQSDTLDVILLDINMPNINGIEASKLIINQYPKTKIIILSMYKKPLIIKELLTIGVHGYILKDTDLKELLKAINTVVKNKTYYDSRVNDLIIEYFKNHESCRQIKLSKREKEVLQNIHLGLTSAQIAEKMFISIYTVDTHRKNLLQKTGLKGSIELAKFYADNEMLLK